MSDHLSLVNIPCTHVVGASVEWCDRDNINVMELWPVLCAINRWGNDMRNRKIIIRSDNSQVVTMLNTGRLSNIQCMRWLRELFWLSFIFNIHIVGVHVKSVDNTLADYLSRASDINVMRKFEASLVMGNFYF